MPGKEETIKLTYVKQQDVALPFGITYERPYLFMSTYERTYEFGSTYERTYERSYVRFFAPVADSP